MASTPETLTTEQVFKDQYVDNPQMDQVPMGLWFMDQIPFDSQHRQGGSYKYPAILRMPQGATYNGGATVGTAFAMNDAIPGQTLQASVTGSEYLLREQTSYGLLSRAGDDKAAFEPGMDLLVRNVVAKTAFDLEVNCLYGGTSLGVVSVKGALVGLVAPITISTASWGVGLWAAREGGQLDAYDPTLVTKRNTNGPITMGVVNFTTHVISMTFTAIGDHTALTVNDVFVPLGANGNWFDGIDAIITNINAGVATVLGIPTATYGLWRANVYDAASGPLTFSILASAAAQAANKGGMETELTALVSVWAWTDINNNQAALRMYGNDYGAKFENGATELVYYGPNGKITIKPHACVKSSEAFLLDKPMLRRIGSTEPTFKLRGSNDKFLVQLPNNAGLEFRRYADMALASFRLCTHTKIINIVNTTSP
jgi:hypothetical protein